MAILGSLPAFASMLIFLVTVIRLGLDTTPDLARTRDWRGHHASGGFQATVVLWRHPTRLVSGRLVLLAAVPGLTTFASAFGLTISTLPVQIFAIFHLNRALERPTSLIPVLLIP